MSSVCHFARYTSCPYCGEHVLFSHHLPRLWQAQPGIRPLLTANLVDLNMYTFATIPSQFPIFIQCPLSGMILFLDFCHFIFFRLLWRKGTILRRCWFFLSLPLIPLRNNIKSGFHHTHKQQEATCRGFGDMTPLWSSCLKGYWDFSEYQAFSAFHLFTTTSIL